MGDQENEIIAGVGNEVFYFFGKYIYGKILPLTINFSVVFD